MICRKCNISNPFVTCIDSGFIPHKVSILRFRAILEKSSPYLDRLNRYPACRRTLLYRSGFFSLSNDRLNFDAKVNACNLLQLPSWESCHFGKKSCNLLYNGRNHHIVIKVKIDFSNFRSSLKMPGCRNSDTSEGETGGLGKK